MIPFNLSPLTLTYKFVVSLLLAIGLFLSATALGQETIQGTVFSQLNDPLAGASISLLRLTDSALIKGTVTDKAGAFAFDRTLPGQYFIEASFNGFATVYSAPVTLSKANARITVPPLHLVPLAASLQAVNVVSKKPLFEQKIDRLVINVASSVTSAGNTALEVLERSPGVVVDHQNNTVTMNGKNGVIVMINGKISRLPIDAVIQMLNGMPSGNIEKIELITTPPAGFDAQGNAGYINIVLKENNNLGTNGSFTLSAGWASGSVAEASANVNHRKGNLNFFADFSLSRNVSPHLISAYSYISNNGILKGNVVEQKGLDTIPSFNGRLGVDWQLSKKTVVGVLLTGYENFFRQSHTSLAKLSSNGLVDTLIRSNNNEENRWLHYGANVNFQHDFRPGEKLLANLDYLYYDNDQPFRYHSQYFTPSDQLYKDLFFTNSKKTPIAFSVASVDYTRIFFKILSMETGLKQTVSRFDNTLYLERLTNGNWVPDPAFNSHYKLRENYSAAYVSFAASLPHGIDLKAGLRYEYTGTNLGNDTLPNVVDRHYGKLFPSLFFSRKLSDKSNLSVTYSRRLTRPSFNDLAPFIFYQNQNTIVTGNPALQTAVSDNFQVGYSLKKLFMALSFSKENDAIAGFQAHTDSVLNRTTISADNLTTIKSVSLTAGLPVRVTAWWNMQMNVNVNWQKPTLLYQGKEITIEQFYAGVNSVQSFILPKNFSIEVSGEYHTGGAGGIQSSHPSGRLDIGARKKLSGRKGTLSLNGVNLLNTGFFTAYTDLPKQNIVTGVKIYYSKPGVKLTYTRNFGKEKLREKRERGTGAEDENSRAH